MKLGIFPFFQIPGSSSNWAPPDPTNAPRNAWIDPATEHFRAMRRCDCRAMAMHRSDGARGTEENLQKCPEMMWFNGALTMKNGDFMGFNYEKW